ncbi:MAG: tetratricopeptide repeat protein, partial [Parvibaculum sp.]|nr:tetratricopeptide repeat protein [Parvibaculum sp.]
DLRGWELAAPAYLQPGRYDRAPRAWTRAISMGGVTAGRLAARGEAYVFMDDGVVGPDAKADFERAVALDPDQPRAQYFLGVAELEAGHRDAALARWRALIARAPDDAPWVPGLKAGIANLEAGPAAAGEDASMIRGMVARLAARLEEEPGDLDGWLRLIHSYRVLGAHDKAAAALASARAAFAGDPEALESLTAAEAAPAN